MAHRHKGKSINKGETLPGRRTFTREGNLYTGGEPLHRRVNCKSNYNYKRLTINYTTSLKTLPSLICAQNRIRTTIMKIMPGKFPKIYFFCSNYLSKYRCH